MSADVLLEMAELRKPATAQRTAVGFDAEVDATVLRKIGRIGEALVARGAAIRLRVRLVNLLAVNQQV